MTFLESIVLDKITNFIFDDLQDWGRWDDEAPSFHGYTDDDAGSAEMMAEIRSITRRVNLTLHAPHGESDGG